MKLAHLGDTHIRNLKFHYEYKVVFEQLYERLRKENVDYIIHCGDIAHTKTQISPEFVEMCSDFFRNLESIAPTYIILGNHDGNLKNSSRQDALTPIVQALALPNLYLLKDSGETILDDRFCLNVLSVFDEDNWTQPTDKDKINIALYHGSISGVKTDIGWTMENGEHDVSIFDNSLNKVERNTASEDNDGIGERSPFSSVKIFRSLSSSIFTSTSVDPQPSIVSSPKKIFFKISQESILQCVPVGGGPVKTEFKYDDLVCRDALLGSLFIVLIEMLLLLSELCSKLLVILVSDIEEVDGEDNGKESISPGRIAVELLGDSLSKLLFFSPLFSNGARSESLFCLESLEALELIL